MGQLGEPDKDLREGTSRHWWEQDPLRMEKAPREEGALKMLWELTVAGPLRQLSERDQMALCLET